MNIFEILEDAKQGIIDNEKNNGMTTQESFDSWACDTAQCPFELYSDVDYPEFMGSDDYHQARSLLNDWLNDRIIGE